MISIEAMQIKLLQAKDLRQMKQRQLLSDFKCTLVSFTLNIPGSIKDSQIYRQSHEIGLLAFVNKCPSALVRHIEVIHSVTGPIGFVSLEMAPEQVKKLAVNTEEKHPLGRLFDIDVFDVKGQQVGRRTLKLPPRKCLICNKDAHSCARNQSHGINELIETIEKICADYHTQKVLLKD